MNQKNSKADIGSLGSTARTQASDILQTLSDLIKSTDPSVFLSWPPDVFALMAFFAKRTGCYLAYSSSPAWTAGLTDRINLLSGKWRSALDTGDMLPAALVKEWQALRSRKSLIADLRARRRHAVEPVLFLLACADETCQGLGSVNRGGSVFELLAELHLAIHDTLCKNLSSETVRVLPKQRVPGSGLNVRSLSRNLALIEASEVRTAWTTAPLLEEPNKPAFNVLICPWPLDVEAAAFRPAKRTSRTPAVGYFDFDPSAPSGPNAIRRWLQRVLTQCEAIRQRVDLVVFPENALTLAQWRSVRKLCNERRISAVAGVRESSEERAKNSVRYSIHLLEEELIQHKHHRWQVDAGQVHTYALGATLDADTKWWENIHVENRMVRFVAVRKDLTLCTLICEDLARQEPISEIVRAVGPNLVIALLMDGPQLKDRWAARYASVLADDPGTSVLTLTSLGMCSRSKPLGLPTSRVVASWKDAIGDYKQIDFESGQIAALLNLQFRQKNQSTVDGRSNHKAESVPVLCGVHPIRA